MPTEVIELENVSPGRRNAFGNSSRIRNSSSSIDSKLEDVDGTVYSKDEYDMIQAKDGRLFGILLIVIQIWLAIIYGVYVKYPDITVATTNVASWGMARDISLMTFFGFGFLLTFLRRYAYSAISYVLLVAALVVQWSIPVQGFFWTVANPNAVFHDISAGVTEITHGLFCATAVLISFGAVLGKVTPSQMLILGFLETIFYWINYYICMFTFGVTDVGGGMTIHTFGAYFGISVCWFLTNENTKSHKDNTGAYNNDLFSLAGTLFLWVCWPSFNAAISRTPAGQVRAVVNTFIALTSSTMGAFAVSRIFSDQKGKFDITHIQNATLAGGVVIATAADLHVTPVGAIIVGFVTGIVTVIGYRFLTPFLSRKLGIQDVAGVHNLHGIPGVFSGIVAIFVTLAATRETYGMEYDYYLPWDFLTPGWQTAALVVSIVMGLGGGSLTGLIMARGWKWGGMLSKDFFNDRTFWKLPSDYEIYNE